MTQRHLINNSELLKNLNTSVNEAHISSTIYELRKEVFKIESFSGRSLRTIKLRNEIAKLEGQLTYGKNQSSPLAQQFRKTKCTD